MQLSSKIQQITFGFGGREVDRPAHQAGKWISLKRHSVCESVLSDRTVIVFVGSQHDGGNVEL